MYILRKTSTGTLLVLDENILWTTNLGRAHSFGSTYGKLVAKSQPTAFTTEQHPGLQDPKPLTAEIKGK